MTKHKHKTWYMVFAAIFLVALVAAGITFIPNDFKAGFLQNTLGTPELIGSYFYGTISCDNAGTKTTDISNANINGQELSNINFAYTDAFQTTVTVPDYSVAWYQIKSPRALYYKICDSSNENSCIQSQRISTPITTTLPTVDNKHFLFFQVVEFKIGSCVLLTADQRLSDASCWQMPSSDPKMSFTTSYTLWKLRRHDALQGGDTPLSETCSDPKTAAQQMELKLVTSDETKKLQFIKDISTSRLNPTESWNYISGIVPLIATIETYSGQDAVCQNNVMYGLSTITTTQGNYRIRDSNKNLGSVACCNGIPPSATTTCVNHKIIDISTPAECSLTKPCPVSDWQINPSDSSRKTIEMQTCNSGKCVMSTKSVECAADSACQNGYACVNYKCVQTGADTGQYTVNGTKTNGNNNVCSWYDFSCKSISEIAGIIAGMIVFIFSWIFLVPLLSKFIFTSKKQYAIAVLVGMLLSGAIAWLVIYLTEAIFYPAMIGATIWVILTTFFTIKKKELGFK